MTRRMLSLLVLLLPVALSPSLQAGKRSPEASIKITAPPGGWTNTRIITINGKVENLKVEVVTLVINGAPRRARVQNGNFSAVVVLGPGENLIQALAQKGTIIVKDQISLFARVPPKDLKVILTWDTDRTDVDLWVTDPNGEKCYYKDQQSKLGGSLDNDVTDGYGPETFTLANAIAGDYLIQVHYYNDHGVGPTRCWVTVVKHEGTANEWRHTFEFVLYKTNDIHNLTAITF